MRELYCTTLLKKYLRLKYTEYLLTLTATMLCRTQLTEIGLEASIMILILKKKIALVHQKSLKRKN